MSAATARRLAAARPAHPRTGPAADVPRPRLHVVGRARPNHAPLWLVAVIALLAASIFGAVSLNAVAAGHSVEARELEVQVAEAERRHAELVAEVAHLDAPERIRRVAIEQLGMVEADQPRYVVLDRALPSDHAAVSTPQGDPLKPVLAAER